MWIIQFKIVLEISFLSYILIRKIIQTKTYNALYVYWKLKNVEGPGLIKCQGTKTVNIPAPYSD